jgi:hypothetical protein
MQAEYEHLDFERFSLPDNSVLVIANVWTDKERLYFHPPFSLKRNSAAAPSPLFFLLKSISQTHNALGHTPIYT